MKKILSITSGLLLLPFVASAQNAQTFVINFTKFLNDTIIPFLFALAFLFFIYNAVRFFIIESSNEDGREKAKSLAIYGVAAFVLIVIFWGLVNMLTASAGLGGCSRPHSDYYLQKVSGPFLPNCP